MSIQYDKRSSAQPFDLIIKSLSIKISELGFTGFCFFGLAERAYADYLKLNSTRLFKKAQLSNPSGLLASSPQIRKAFLSYLSSAINRDSNFNRLVKAERPFFFNLKNGNELSKFGIEFDALGIESILSFPVRRFSSEEWHGNFVLFSNKSPLELDLSRLEVILSEAQLEFFESDRNHFNPFRQSNVFKENSIRVLSLVAEGLPNREVAAKVFLSERGVEYHVELMKMKLAAVNRANLIHIANKLELV